MAKTQISLNRNTEINFMGKSYFPSCVFSAFDLSVESFTRMHEVGYDKYSLPEWAEWNDERDPIHRVEFFFQKGERKGIIQMIKW